jgi:hypothetical protein
MGSTVFTPSVQQVDAEPHSSTPSKRLIRVFPRKTKASPDDDLAYFGEPDLFAEADEVHVKPPCWRRRGPITPRR